MMHKKCVWVTASASLVVMAVLLLNDTIARADNVTSGGNPAENIAAHVQTTFTEQYAPPFHSPYTGPNSLLPDEDRQTFDVTAYPGIRLWRGAEAWINPEIEYGFGLSKSVGLAGFSSGEAYKVGKWRPYYRMQRAFIRQTIGLDRPIEKVEGGLNQLSGEQSANRLVLTIGKLSVVDIFDTNKYAHDPRNDFLNWSIVDNGSFDYAADAWGFTDGAALEWYHDNFAARGGFFATSTVPNSKKIETNFDQFQWEGELEESHALAGRHGKLRVAGFLTEAKMAAYDEATNLALATHTTPSLDSLRRHHAKPGCGINLEQELTDDLGFFARGGISQGKYEAFDFTDINRTISGGLSLNGTRWNRREDTIGVGFAVNDASRAAKRFISAGGLGILVGDGRLPEPAPEQILEIYYSFALTAKAKIAADYQFAADPAYNEQRGPVSIFGVRGHVEY